MYVYNLTVVSEPKQELHLEKWLKQVLIPEYFMGNFFEVTIFKVENSSKDTISYAIHSCCLNSEDIDAYCEKYEKKVQSLLWEKFQDKALCFSTRLQMISKENAKG